jgi:hypothetical protein
MGYVIGIDIGGIFTDAGWATSVFSGVIPGQANARKC